MAEYDLKELEKIRQNKDVLDYLEQHGILEIKKFNDVYDYEKELYDLQVTLLKLQYDIIEKGKRVVIIFEGRDAAGKGGTIGRVTEHLNPKKVRVVALPKPTVEENGQWYFQRHIKHLPNAGEMVIFDRSYYNRAVVEPVFDFCTKEQHELFMQQVPEFEKQLIDDGIILIKLFLSISKEEQAERLKERQEDILKRWKVGVLDQQAQEKWDVYTGYIEKLFKTTATKKSPWFEIDKDNKKKARLAAFRIIINVIAGNEQEKLDSFVNKHN
ncbi:polyphosphate kinase 2 [Sphingobacterium sp. BIGb0165]|uniref:polyphosphate kinase 2 n=1 Tax=Sphingobacterium sp. BIGb0165 TaxID=2940615 RepID=UPI002167DB3F|nr:polyphosphate kinase 2 [Sphingobacterium sp. BIGb0165]MCS4224257.1 polyphosphate kinase 2 [Sphingobacterium sp. BIGb0165]